jgi:hypothetical protein
VLAVMIGLRRNYLDHLRQFESMYVQRYWMILDHLSLDALRGRGRAQSAKPTRRPIRS